MTKEQLAKLLKEGKITQEEHDSLLANIDKAEAADKATKEAEAKDAGTPVDEPSDKDVNVVDKYLKEKLGNSFEEIKKDLRISGNKLTARQRAKITEVWETIIGDPEAIGLKIVKQEVSTAPSITYLENFWNAISTDESDVPAGNGIQYFLNGLGQTTVLDPAIFTPQQRKDLMASTFVDYVTFIDTELGTTEILKHDADVADYLYIRSMVSTEALSKVIAEFLAQARNTLKVSKINNLITNGLKPIYTAVMGKSPFDPVANPNTVPTSNHFHHDYGVAMDESATLFQVYLDANNALNTMEVPSLIYNYGTSASTTANMHNNAQPDDIKAIMHPTTATKLKGAVAATTFNEEKWQVLKWLTPDRIVTQPILDLDTGTNPNLFPMVTTNQILFVDKRNIRTIFNLDFQGSQFWLENMTTRYSFFVRYNAAPLKWCQCAVYEWSNTTTAANPYAGKYATKPLWKLNKINGKK